MSDDALTVVIPTYNHAELLLECLRSVAQQTQRPERVIVVDDGSSEDISGLLAKEFPCVDVVRLERNQGFCRAANAGLRAAATPYVFLLNNDMTLDPECVALLMQHANPRTIQTPLVLFRSERDTIYSAGDRILTNGRPESIGFRVRREGFAWPSRILGVTGGAAFFPQAVLQQVGYFDERFVAYFEDADLCLRARLAGFDCALVPGAVAYHVGSASLDGKMWRRSAQCFRNHGLLVLKNFPIAVALRFFPAIVCERFHQAAMVLSSARSEFGLAGAIGVLIKAAASFAAAVPHALYARRLLRYRAISDREFIEMLTRPGERR